MKCLLRVSDWAVKFGNLTGLLITGLTPRGGELIEVSVLLPQLVIRVLRFQIAFLELREAQRGRADGGAARTAGAAKGLR